jgi:hypothetical protein
LRLIFRRLSDVKEEISIWKVVRALYGERNREMLDF